MRVKLKFLLVLILGIIPLNEVFASSELNISCPAGGIVGSVINCEILSKNDVEISAVKTNLMLSDNLEFVSFNKDSVWQGDGSNGEISLYTYPNLNGDFRLGTVSIRIKNESSKTGTITLGDIYFYKGDFSKVSANNKSINVKILSTNNYLSSLSLVGFGISPSFNRDVLEYSATVDSDVVAIEASSEDSGAIIEGIGTKNLSYGVNNFSIVVTSESGSKREYKLFITRDEKVEDNKNNDNNESLDEEVDNSNQDNDNSDNTSVEDNNVEVSPPQEEVKKDDSSKLKSLVIEGYDIEFSSDIYLYYINISSDVDSVVVDAIATSEKAKIEVSGNSSLVIGKNEILVTVTAEDGSKSVYTIYATKKSDICVVNSINVKGYNLEFDCNKHDYELEIWDEKNLNIDVITNDGLGKVDIYNNHDLVHGDIIKVVVTYEGVQYKYNIKVLKSVFEIENIINSKQLMFLIVVIVVTLLYLVGRYIVKKHKKRVGDNS